MRPMRRKRPGDHGPGEDQRDHKPLPGVPPGTAGRGPGIRGAGELWPGGAGGEAVPLLPRAKEGRKADLIRSTGYACFEMDTGYRLQDGDSACDYTRRLPEHHRGGDHCRRGGPAEKEAGLDAVMNQITGKDQWTYGPAMLEAVGCSGWRWSASPARSTCDTS